MHAVVNRLATAVLSRTLRGLGDGCLEVWIGEAPLAFGDPAARRRAVVRVWDPRVFRRVLVDGDVGFGDAYVDGDWSSPDLVGVLRLAVRNLALFEDSNRVWSAVSRWRGRVAHRLRANTRSGSRRNIHAHYDLGNEFYELFLDPSMAYSCGIYPRASSSLEDAQEEKFDRICRKLRLGPSDHVLEIGTGWGGFAAWAARRYGCRVTTTTISVAQYAYAAALFARLGLGPDRVRLLLEDYRDLSGRFDKIVSIEMFEAVGHRHYDAFFGQAQRLLGPDGTLLLQMITVPDQRFARYLAAPDWIQQRVFPGAELASVGRVLESVARVTRLSLYHLEEIGAHYARTLQAWRERFLGAADRVRALGFDERFIRTWEYYLAACEAAFLERQIGDVQLVLASNRTTRALMDEPWPAEGDCRPAAGDGRAAIPSAAACGRPAPDRAAAPA
jgi:cyclopropane-fatty-acyl-phospholipid synthase